MKRITAFCILFSITLSSVNLLAQKPDRSSPPPVGPVPDFKIPKFQEFELSNGLPVLLLEKHDVPLVQTILIVNAGAVIDGKRGGLSSLTATMLDEGVGTMSALEFSEAVDFLGANLSISAGFHTTEIALNTPLSKLDAALELMSGVVLKPTFPQEELDRIRKSRLTQIAQWHQEARDIAAVLYDRVLYGKKHPYGVPRIGNEKSLRAFKTGDLKTFHDTYYKPNNSMLVLVGDITKNSMVPKLERVFSNWKPSDVPETTVPVAIQVESTRVYLVDKPEAAQSEIRIGRIGVERTNEDYYAIAVMNTILGGAFTSRLNQNLREEHGYTYGARSSFSFRPRPGPFTASAAVHTEVTKEALSEFMNELNGILEDVTDKELNRAKNFVALRYPSRFQTISGIASQLVDKMVYGLPDDYFDNYIGNILSVTVEDVHRVANKYIQPDKMAIVVVGDRVKIEDSVKLLNLGKVKTMSIKDVLGVPPKVE